MCIVALAYVVIEQLSFATVLTKHGDVCTINSYLMEDVEMPKRIDGLGIMIKTSIAIQLTARFAARHLRRHYDGAYRRQRNTLHLAG